MISTPCESVPPQFSRVAARLPGAYFSDAWAIRAASPELSAFGQYLRVASKTPAWVETLMTIRNRIVALLGLKNLGGLSQLDGAKPESAYQPGDRVGIFTLISNAPNEVLLGDKDKHLEVVVSVHKARGGADGHAVVTVTTVVHVHNWLGKLYMVPVTPVHRVIARAMVKAVGNAS